MLFLLLIYGKLIRTGYLFWSYVWPHTLGLPCTCFLEVAFGVKLIYAVVFDSIIDSTGVLRSSYPKDALENYKKRGNPNNVAPIIELEGKCLASELCDPI